MRRVSSAEFVRRFSAYCDEALTDPLVLTRNGRDRLLIVNIEQYRHLLSLALINAEPDATSEQISDELGFLMTTRDRRSSLG